jgi:septal ring factor EnvC (AmiA/AmiB activator)
VKTVNAWLRGLRCVSRFAVLAIGFAWLTPVGAAQAQGDVKKASSLDKKREALLAELEEIRQALKKTQADLEGISRLSEALKKKQADLAATEADLKKRAAKIRDSLEKLAGTGTKGGRRSAGTSQGST